MTGSLTALEPGAFAFAIINALGALVAAVINVMAYRRTGRGGPQTAYALTAGYAAVYSVAYLVLAFTNVAPAEWSSTMRGVSILTWPVVWSSHAAAKVWGRSSEHWGDAVIQRFRHELGLDPAHDERQGDDDR